MDRSLENIDIQVVIPAYNAESTIVDTLNSICNQTAFNNISKIIVIDDGSKDNTFNIVKKYSINSTIPIEIITQKNKGVSAARNLGISKVSKNSWVALCDSDDLWIKNKIDTQINIIKNNKDIDFLGAAFQDKPIKIGLKKINKLHKASVNEILIKNFPQPSTVIFKKKIFDEIGGFDENQRYAEDGNYFLKICYNYNFYYLPQRLIEYGAGKRGFGESGLSKNLKAMYLGNIKNLRDMLGLKYISYSFYLEMRIYYYIKYIRRIIITKIRGRKK